MQVKSSRANQVAPRSRGWYGGVFAAVVLASALLSGPVVAQRGGANSDPFVGLTSSASQILTTGSATLTASAFDSDGTITKVEFYKNGALVATDTTTPYNYVFSSATPGPFVMTARAYDDAGASAVSNGVSILVNSAGNGAPTVTMVGSPNSVAVGSPVALTATANDADGTISKIQFYNGSTLLGEVSGAGSIQNVPGKYNFLFTPSAPGIYLLNAIAFDNLNLATTSNSVSVSATATSSGGRGGGTSGGGNSPPTVSLGTSSTMVSVGGTVTLTANAADSDGSIAKVEFLQGGAKVSTDTMAPYAYAFTPSAPGTYAFSALATDNVNASATSNTVTITATAAPVATGGPRVTLSVSNTAPSGMLVTPGSIITLNATALATATGATVSRVSFYLNGAKLVDDTMAPYSTTATLATPGNYSVYATATDSLNQTSTTLTQIVVAQTAAAVATISADIWRLLNQATFGASQAEAARVNSLGITGWINDQLIKPISGYPDSKYNRIQLSSTADCTTQMPNKTGNYPGDSPQAVCSRDHLTLAMVQRNFFTNAVSASDQLRQRVAWALSQILVTSANESDLSYAHVMSRYQNLLFEGAFGNFETMLQKVTYNAAMGNYLDMVNNDRPSGTRVPNENYAREIMQLFSVGLYELNGNGTPLLDASNQPIQTYGQTEIGEFARVFTGYTYATAADPTGTAPAKRGTRYYGAPMVPYAGTATTGHDPDPKTLLNGTTLGAGKTAKEDIDAAVRNVFMHPNTGPFISKQLIQRLVTGDPSPAYVARISAIFANNGSNVRGDMAAVVKAILLDAEARGVAKKTAANFGQLREPVLMVTGMIRALSGVTDGASLEGAAGALGQRPYYASTVFNYFMPDTTIPGSSVLGPEFQIHTTYSAIGRANLVYRLVYQGYNADTTIPNAQGTRLFIAQFEPLADNPAAMVQEINKVLAGGQFPTTLEPTIVTAVNAIAPGAVTLTATQRTDRARMAVYLMASSYDYQVQR